MHLLEIETGQSWDEPEGSFMGVHPLVDLGDGSYHIRLSDLNADNEGPGVTAGFDGPGI